MSASIAAVVTVLAVHRRVSPFERPTRLPVLEARGSAPRPADERRASAQMLDVTSAAVLSSVLASVQALLPSYPCTQVIVAPKASIRVEPPSRRMAFTAVRIAVDASVITAELTRREKLGPGLPRRQRSGKHRGDHQAAHDDQRCGAPAHSEKIQRYP